MKPISRDPSTEGPRPGSPRRRLRSIPSASRPLGALAGLAIAAFSSAARAEGDVFTGVIVAVAESLRELNFHSQVQAGLFAVSANDFQAGGVGARAGFNVLGFGGSAGVRLERYRDGAGGLGLLDFEFRPLPFREENFYRVLDPFVSAGLEIGGGDHGFRATQTLGAGLDIGLFGRPESNHEVVHPVITLRYQLRTFQLPEGEAQHLLLIGAATRLVF